MTKDRILIIDGMNTFIRCWAVVPQMSTNGDHVGGIIGFLRSIKANIRDARPTRTIIVWDGKGGSQQRRGVYAEYKAGRKPRVNREYDFGESPEDSKRDMGEQLLRARQYTELLGISQIEIDAIEADDVIAYLCRHLYQDTDKVVVSTDRDFLQLVDRHTLVYSPSRKLYFTAAVVKEKHLVIPENFIYVKALMGDASDNIKGIGGIGEKTAVKLFPFLAERPSSLEEVIEYARTNQDKKPKYKAVYDGREVLNGNVQLMQLTMPIISAQSVAAIRYSLRPTETKFVMSEVMLLLLRDGIQLTDSDFFSTFKEYHVRSKNGEQPNV